MLSKTNFQCSQGYGKLLILYFEPKGNEGQFMWCKICGMCVPTLNWRWKEQCECCKGFCLFQENFFCTIQKPNKE